MLRCGTPRVPARREKIPFFKPEIKRTRIQMTSKANGRGGSRPGAGRKPKQPPEEIKPAKNQMPAKSGQRGGARSGAGRKPKVQPEATKPKASAVKESLEPQAHGGALKRAEATPVEIDECNMLKLLQDVALGRVEATNIQVRAAIAAVQYTHTKKGDGGKKDAQKDAAKKAGGGRFASAAPPKLVSSGGKNV